MADLILECGRAGRAPRDDARQRMAMVARRISPSNIVARPPRILEAQGLCVTIVNPSGDGIREADGGVLLGGLLGDAGRWWITGAEPPDGAYALVRYSSDRVELLSDVPSSRTLWYAWDEERLIASTSQRAVVALLGSFDLDRSAVAWLLSAGTLGPDRSWDSRIRRVPPDACLSFDRRAWRPTLDQRPAVFEPVRRSRDEHLGLLRDAVARSCGDLDIDTSRWLLPLSGGLDSRTILVFMVRNGRSPRCVTWTTRASTKNPLSDAVVARLLARRFHARHDYLFLDSRQAVAPGSLQRFVEVGEGRTDEFAAYVDGCAMWAGLFDAGVSGVIRGDEPLGGRRRAVSLDAARRQGSSVMVRDYPEGHLIRRLGLADQDVPEWLRPRPGEGLEAYRDRMYHQGYIPNSLAPLTEIKCRYLEVANPLLARDLFRVVRSLPDELRMYGRAMMAIVDPETRPIPHARFVSTPAPAAYLAEQEIVREVVATLASPSIESVMGEAAAVSLLTAAASPSQSPVTVASLVVSAMKALRVALPSRLAYRLTPRFAGPNPLSAAKLAFRATLASKTVEMFRRDAEALDRRGPDAQAAQSTSDRQLP